jgi:hypothetical protein
MKKIILTPIIILFILGLGCKRTPNLSNSNIVQSDSTIVFFTPESAIDSFFYGIQNNKTELLEKCYNGQIEKISFQNFRVRKYFIINKELIKKDETLYRQKGDLCIKIGVVNINYDTIIISYNLRKKNNSWIIIGYSSEFEDQMEEDIQNAINELPSIIDSIDKYRMRKSIN